MKRREALVSLFQACNTRKPLAQLHSQTLKSGLSNDTFFATKLIALYSKHESLGHARKVFDETPQRSVHLWNATLRSYCREKQWEETLFLFDKMLLSDRMPDNFTISVALKACAGLRVLGYGRVVHGFVKRNEKIAVDVFVGSALIEFYSKCGKMGEAVKVFDEFSQPDVFLWTNMVTGYEQNGNAVEALEFLSRMVTVGRVKPERVTLVSAVSACAQLSSFRLGSCVHGVAIRSGFDSDLCLVNSLLNLYAKTGSIRTASSLFWKMPEKDVISWSSMIACYTHNGYVLEALDLFREMIDRGVEPNSVTVSNALQACAVACNLDEGKKIHELATRKGFELDVTVATALIDMYMKCSQPQEAVDLFKRMPKKDVVSWVAMLSGYAQNGMAYKSMGIFRNMLLDETQPDAVAMVKILAACSELGNLQQALCLHAYAIKTAFKDNIFIGASLIELYSKCGSIDNAVRLFEGMVFKDVVIWSAMIAGYGIHGQGGEALKAFDHMVKHAAVTPNDVTFTSVLSACSHSGLVEEGLGIFDMMLHQYQVKPRPEHYGILVDLLGRTGELDKAMEIVERMPNPTAPHVWGALLGACQIHNNIELGEVVAKRLLELEPDHAGYYVLLSNIYAMDDKWENVSNLRTSIKEKGLKKIFGQSVVEAGSEIHCFVAGDRFHPEFDRSMDC
ncbi:putative pentatricopeptide repeat-containing protein [Rosa sericea]